MLKIEIKTGNAAFQDELYEGADDYCMRLECLRILSDIRGKIADGYSQGKCMDINGNAVGNWSLD